MPHLYAFILVGWVEANTIREFSQQAQRAVLLSRRLQSIAYPNAFNLRMVDIDFSSEIYIDG